MAKATFRETVQSRISAEKSETIKKTEPVGTTLKADVSKAEIAKRKGITEEAHDEAIKLAGAELQEDQRLTKFRLDMETKARTSPKAVMAIGIEKTKGVGSKFAKYEVLQRELKEAAIVMQVIHDMFEYHNRLIDGQTYKQYLDSTGQSYDKVVRWLREINGEKKKQRKKSEKKSYKFPDEYNRVKARMIQRMKDGGNKIPAEYENDNEEAVNDVITELRITEVKEGKKRFWVMPEPTGTVTVMPKEAGGGSG
jgi:hypothetical protein